MMPPNFSRAIGEVLTFYSYKGGSGRSMLLANVAWLLASAGKRVLIIDWDLEAPGLHRYFRPFLGDDTELENQEGVIEWVSAYWDEMVERPDGVNLEEIVRGYADPRSFVRQLDTKGYLFDGGIDLMCAGRQDRNYAEAVSDFDWTLLYQNLRGAEFIACAKKILVGEGGYDYVLIDSRTGVSDTSGFCTVGFADTLVACFTYNIQSSVGTSNVVRDIASKARKLRQEVDAGEGARPFRLFAVPTRVDDLDPERLERRQRHAWCMFADLLSDIPEADQPQYWTSVQIRNHGLFSYEEVLAVCVNRPGDPQSTLGAITNLIKHLTRGAFVEQNPLSDEQRAELRLRFAKASKHSPQRPTAWEQYERWCSDNGIARDEPLLSCLPLLAQAVVLVRKDSDEPHDLARETLLEIDLSDDEQMMANVLIRNGLMQWRITNDRQRGLSITDDSIIQRWESLRQQILEHKEFILLRQRVREARRTWEFSGRSIGSARAAMSSLDERQLLGVNDYWLGKSNLRFLALLRDVRNIDLELEKAKDVAKNVRTQQRRSFYAGSAVIALIAIAALEISRNQDAASKDLFSQLQEAQAKNAMVQQDAIAAKNSLVTLRASQRKIEVEAAYFKASLALAQADKSGNYEKVIRDFGAVIAMDPQYAEAYKGRALAWAGNTGNPNPAAENADWGIYLNLKPSLRSRTKFILEMVRKKQLDDELLVDQLRRLVTDASQTQSRDDDPRSIAKRLQAQSKLFPVPVQEELTKTINLLRNMGAVVQETVQSGESK